MLNDKTINLKSYSSIVLSLAGLLLAGMGLYFIFIRPPLLPEDLSYMGITLQNTKANIPGLLNWLEKVFWVMGGYIFTTGFNEPNRIISGKIASNETKKYSHLVTRRIF